MSSLRHHRSGQRGIALVVVLVVVILIFGICVGLLSRVSSERISSQSNYSAANVRLLANTAVQIVQGQIDTATTPPAAQSTQITWSSQPGLIRTYDNTGTEIKCYKLYSSDAMQVTGALNPATEVATLTSPAPWYNSPAIYTDLNNPVDSDNDGEEDFYPIVDPSSLDSGVHVPQGFSITGAPKGEYQGITNEAPMPVRWLYQLQDGTLVSPTGSGTSASVAGASSSNPIVGRIAFWTDDETCKVNVNTASEGSFWDIPRVNSNQDVDLANFQPVKNEFQAFPGHPATTSLSAVFTGSMLDPASLHPAKASDTYDPAKIFSIVPRLQFGGSQGGTKTASSAITLDTDRLYPNNDELLFSIDLTSGLRGLNDTRTSPDNVDICQSQLEAKSFFITTSSRSPEINLFNLPKIACWPISSNSDPTYRTAYDQTIAFCSTLNGQPYYFQRANSHSATADYSGRNAVLYPYLQNILNRDVPGFGGNLATKFGADSNQILTEIFDYIRSTDLWDGNLAPTGTTWPRQYTEGKTTNDPTSKVNLPGHGQVVPIQIGSTMGFGRFLTVSEVGVQFICCADGTDTAGQSYTNSSGSTFLAIPSNNPDGTLPGFTVKNLTLIPGTPLLPNAPAPSPLPAGTTKQLRIEAMAILEQFCPMQGFETLCPDLQITIDGLQNWTLQGNADGSGVNLGLPSEARQTSSDAGLFIQREVISYVLNWGGQIGTKWSLYNRGLRARNGGRLTEDPNFSFSSQGDGVKDRQYPWVSEPVTITVLAANPLMTLNAGPIVIKIMDRKNPGSVVQTINVNFPNQTNIPAPKLAPSGLPHDATALNAVATQDKDAPQWWTFQSSGAAGSPGRFSSAPQGQYYNFVDPNIDVVRTAVPVADSTATPLQTWDYRLLAATALVPLTQFAAHPYDTSSTYLVSAFTGGISGVQPAGGKTPSNATPAVSGKLATDAGGTVYYELGDWPDLPFPATQAQATGDWDNGCSYAADGPYINKPDEGNASGIGTTSAPYYGNANPATAIFSSLFTSPNRIIPSPVMFGSLPTGVKRNQGWQTLLFRRQPNHPSYVDSSGTTPKGDGGFSNAPDYLLLDDFWMPVVQPYAISEPLSTSGKINLNQQIIPFTYITRDTGLYAVMKNEKVMAIPSADGGGLPTGQSTTAPGYKRGGGSGGTVYHYNLYYRWPIDIPNTLKQFQFRYTNSDGTGMFAFRTPSEICDMHLIPDVTASTYSGNTTDANFTAPRTDTKANLDTDMATRWTKHALTGDNTRERPYATIYPRLTTKSNTYTVHFRAQTLKQVPGSDFSKWIEGQDVVTADYRGSTMIERYIDPNNVSIPDYAANPDATPSLPSFYRWHTRSYHQFTP